MKNEIQKIYEVFENHRGRVAQRAIPIDEKKLHLLLSSFYSLGTSFQYVFDYSSKDFTYVSENLKDILGIDPSGFTSTTFFERIHPDDLEHVRNCIELVWYFLYEVIDPIDIPFYKTSYQYRIKDKHGNFKLTLHQDIAMSVDENNLISGVLAIDSDISHITTTNSGKISFIDTRGKKSYFNIAEKEDLLKPILSDINISSRELDILRLLSEGYSSKEIASQLHISYDTVRTHRNNILKKTDFKNLTHAISHFIREGLI